MTQKNQAELENNVFFWQKLDTLVLSGNMEMVRPAGSPSVDYPRLVYPADFLKITDAISSTGVPLYAFRGSKKTLTVDAVIVQADILAREVLAKVLISCTDKEIEHIIKFINGAEFQKGILVRRGSSVPNWADTDQ